MIRLLTLAPDGIGILKIALCFAVYPVLHIQKAHIDIDAAHDPRDPVFLAAAKTSQIIV